ncbi:MAG TPA: YncE family protein [Candidatus Acidoferrales bacterium]
MSWWKYSAILTLATALGALGCGSSASSTVTITISPTTTSVITNRTQPFSAMVTGNTNTAVTWTLTCETVNKVVATNCGSVDATGLYTAPPILPTVTVSGTTTVAPAVTVTATSQADTSKFATASLTIVTAISIMLTPTSATVGTGETFLFAATVNNPGCNLISNPTCQNVTWSLSTTLTGIGSIGSTTGVYTAPTSVPNGSAAQGGSTVVITATSVADTSVTATATVNVVTASTPTVTSVTPNTTALGSLFQDVYITGTNFISTENVFINNQQLASSFVFNVSSTVIRARIPDKVLAAPPPSGILQIGVSEQTGAIQTCTVDPSLCNIKVNVARPGVVGPTPTTLPQEAAGVQSFNVDGGFFGTGSNPPAPAVTATFNGQLRGVQLSPSQSINSTRRLTVSLGGGSNSSDLAVPGLYPVAIRSNSDPSKFAVSNIAVQPIYKVPSAVAVPVGTAPSDVAINFATGIVVVTNMGSNDITLLDISSGVPGAPLVASICTAAVGAAAPCPVSGPSSVSVDSVRNIALVVNSTSKTIAVVDLQKRAIASVIPIPPGETGVADTPGAVAVNPVTGRALVTMQQKNYGILVDLTGSSQGIVGTPCVPNIPCIAGIVSITTGPNARVAVDPNLNWALATPGTAGSLGIVDLNQQSSNAITAISRTNNGVGNVVTVTVASTSSSPPLSVQVGDAVFIQNIQFPVCSTFPVTTNCPPGSVSPAIAMLAPGFDGFYQVSSVGPGFNQFSYTQTQNATLPNVATQAAPQATTTGASVNYAQPVAIFGVPLAAQGIAINPETAQAVLVDPSASGSVLFFSLLDQSISQLNLSSQSIQDLGTIATAYNPLTNIVVTVNSTTNNLYVIDPTGKRRLNDGQPFISTLNGPVAVAIDPGSNIAVVANQKGNTVSILTLGAIKPFSITETSPKTIITASSFLTPPNPSQQTITVSGKGLTCSGGTTSLSVRLDGIGLATSCSGSSDRQLTALVPANMLISARRYALDVADSSGNVTNAEDLTVEQSVNVSSTACPTPLPSGVAVDPQTNFAFVTLFGCNQVAQIDLNTASVAFAAVGANPIGVAVLPRLGVAVVANNGGNGTASIINYQNQTPVVTQTVGTGAGPIGAAANDATGQVAIANSVANTVTVVDGVNGGTSTISTGQRPIAVGFNYVNGQVAAAASSGNSLGVSGGTSGAASQTFPINAPTSVIYDPVTTDCGSNNGGTTTNTTGCFIVTSSTANSVLVIDPVSSAEATFGVGINPTSLAYNYRTSTLVTTNTGSHTISVVDFLGQIIRAVLPLPPTNAGNSDLALSLATAGAIQYALDIQPFTNIAVIADTVNGQVLFVPLPR